MISRHACLAAFPCFFAVVLVVTPALRRESTCGADEPRAVGLRKQLLVDDYVIAESSGVTRELGQVEKADGGRPIFSDGRFYGTVLFDEGRFRMWWRKPETAGYGLAESRDGLRFDKVADVTGINFAGDYTLAVTRDAHESDPAHRYKAGYDAPGMAAGIAHSADGVRWTPYHDGRPVTGRAADSYNQILWDERAQTYRLFTRSDFGPAGGVTEWRGTRGMTNPDLRRDPAGWKTVREWVFDREGRSERERRQIYALSVWIHEGVYLALMTVYDWPGDLSEGPVDLVRRHERDVLNFYIATSRDGDSWDLRWVYAGQPLVPRGGEGAFDKDLIVPASEIVTHDDRHWIYYSGADERHGTEQTQFPRTLKIGLATLPLDRFVALSAAGRTGTVVTHPFVLVGDALEVNVDARAGNLSVELLDEERRPLPGFSGDEAAQAKGLDALRWRPHWPAGGSLATLRGRTVRLRFRLRDAQVYAFQVR